MSTTITPPSQLPPVETQSLFSTFAKYLSSKPFVAISCLIAGFIYGGIFFAKTYEQTDQIRQSEYQQLTDTVAKLKVENLDKDTINKELDDKWKNEKQYLLNKIKQVSQSSFSTVSRERYAKTFDFSNNEFQLEEVYYSGEDSPPIGYVAFYKNGDVKSKTYDHDIVINSITSKDSSGNFVVLSKASLILREESKVDKNKVWFNKEFGLQIKGGSIKINPLEDVVSRTIEFSPSLTLNFDAIVSSDVQYMPAVGVSLFKINNKKGELLMLPEVQFAMNKKDNFAIMFSPVSLNLGNFLPLVKRTYIKPLVGLHNNSFSYGLGIGLNF